MNKKIIIYCAEYLLFLHIGLVIVVSFQDWNIKNQLGTILSAGILSVVSLSVSKVLKRIIHRARPPKNGDLFVPGELYAFPSGHATGLASLTFFIFQYSTSLGVVAIIATLIIVTARVKSHVHYVSDIIAGLVLGTVVTYILFDPVLEYVFNYIIPAVLK